MSAWISRVPHAGHVGSLRTLTVRNCIPRVSMSSSRPLSGSPAPTISLIASVACILPTSPGSTPSTPPYAQLGSGFQLFLAGDADVGQDQMPAVANQLGLDESGHGSAPRDGRDDDDFIAVAYARRKSALGSGVVVVDVKRDERIGLDSCVAQPRHPPGG